MSATELNTTLDHLFRHEYAKIVSLLTNKFSAELIDQIEDAVQESLLKAAKLWAMQPMPDNPSAWLYRVASNHLIDQLRRNQKSTTLDHWKGDSDFEEISTEEEQLIDDQLRMIFACCHPSMKIQEQLMLSLKLLCGLSVKEIARALLKNEEATKKAITRAKQKFKTEVGELVVPRGGALKERLESVLQVVYLLFNEGYKATEGDQLMRQDLCEEAIRLAFIITNEKACETSELYSLIALMLFKAARFPARIDAEGRLVTLELQDRKLYREDYMQWGWKFLHESSKSESSSIYQLEAAIASYYTVAPSYEKTNWKQILRLYDALVRLKPSPVVKMSRLFVLSKVEGPALALAQMDSMNNELPTQQSFQALKADLYAQLHDFDNAISHIEKAIDQADNKTERRFLEERLLSWKKH
uniref:RNA polymerase sigma factor n=1 Tax=Roseivirga sp. TaxID=1964215 RepID=UPI0040483476